MIHFLVERTTIENPIFICKTSLSKTNFKTNWTGCTKAPITKNEVLPLARLLFWKFDLRIGSYFKQLIWYTRYSNIIIYTFRKRLSFIWDWCVFAVSILKTVFKFTKIRMSYQKCSIKNVALKNFAVFTEKQLCWSSFLIKLQASSPATF